MDIADIRDARPSPSRRGLKRAGRAAYSAGWHRCKTIPFEKGTETQIEDDRDMRPAVGCKTIPFEKGTETGKTAGVLGKRFEDARPSPSRRGLKLKASISSAAPLAMQDHPLREGD